MRRTIAATCTAIALLGWGPLGPLPAAAAINSTMTTAGLTNSQNKTTTAYCGSDAWVVGGGGRINSADGQAGMTFLSPTLDGRDFFVTAREDESGFAGQWNAPATVLCSYEVPGRQVVAATSVPASVNARSVTVSCPAGKRVLGAFGGVTGGFGQVVLDDLRPAADLRSVTVTGIEDQDGFAGNWAVTARAVCALALPGLQLITTTSPVDSAEHKELTMSCPAGTEVHSIGAEITRGAGQVRLDAMIPQFGFQTHVLIGAIEDEDGHADRWSVTGHVICAAGNPPGRASAGRWRTAFSAADPAPAPVG